MGRGGGRERLILFILYPIDFVQQRNEYMYKGHMIAVVTPVYIYMYHLLR